MIRRSLLLPPVFAAPALALTSCGFRPMLADSTNVAPRLSGISVETSEGRAGYLAGVALRDRLGTWEGDRARYVLRTRASVFSTGTALTIDQVATRVLVRLELAYGLYDIESGQLLTQSNVVGQATFDLPGSTYAGIRAEQDATQRAAEDAASRAALELSRYFIETDIEEAEERAAADLSARP